MRLITRTVTTTVEDEWGTPTTRTTTHLSWFAARRQRRMIARWRAERAAAADAAAVASEKW